MNQIFVFEGQTPPMVTEAMLRDAIEKRRLQRQTLLLTLAAILTQACLVALGLCLYPTQPLAAFICLAYACLSVTGGGLLALIYTQKRRLVQ